MEKSVRYGSISLVLLCFYASSSFAALEIMTSAEKLSLHKIEHQYDINTLQLPVNDKLLQLDKKADEIVGLKKLIISEKQRYDELLVKLAELEQDKDALTDINKKIEASVNLVYELTLKVDQHSKRLEAKKTELLAEYEAINTKIAAKNQLLFTLKTDIINRLITDLSKSNSTLPVVINSSIECSKYPSIADCLIQSKKKNLSNTVNESPFLNDKSILLSYEMMNASININGDLHYKVVMKFTPSYNNKIDSILNEKLGLKSAMLTLISDVSADWYINNTKIGTGKKLYHELPLGQHSILASYQKQNKSSVENIKGNGVINYQFNHITATKKITNEPNMVAASVSKSINKRSDDAQMKSADKGYEYFMGVTPLSKKQNIEFTNEPVEK